MISGGNEFEPHPTTDGPADGRPEAEPVAEGGTDSGSRAESDVDSAAVSEVDSATVSEDGSAPASDVPKSRGPKRWGVEPDWSKLPQQPRRNTPVDVPEWGASSLDARDLVGRPTEADSDPAPAWATADFKEMTIESVEPVEPAGPVSPQATQAQPDRTRPVQTQPAKTEPVQTQAPQGPPGQTPSEDAPVAETWDGGHAFVDVPPGSEPVWDDGPGMDPGFDPYSDPGPDPYPSLDPAAEPTEGAGPPDSVGPKAAPGHAVPDVHRSPEEDPADLREDAEQILKRLVGHSGAQLRQDQWQAIEALVAHHRRALVVQRTGWGKSAVYFVATALLRARGAGPSVIISPLLALMRDQIAAASRAGVRAVTINSANVTEWDSIHAQIASGEVDVLLCSPERLNNPDFRDEVLPRLAASAGLVVIDEAHCISDWGHDFRPDYRRIRTLIADLPPGIPVLATTATANERVTRDVAEQLAVTGVENVEHPESGPGHQAPDDGSINDTSVLVLRGALDRESLRLAVLPVTDQPTRVAWLIDALTQFEGSGIVYCLTVAAAEQVAEQLRTRGLKVAAYTGRTDPAERELLEADLKENRVKALIATSALGMGFDKPDLSFVIHLGAPSSPIAYYQQVGRAGRGVDSATVVLVPGEEDARIWEYFGSLGFPAESQVRAVLDALDAGGVQSVAKLETQVDLRRSRLEMMLKVLDVDDVVKRVRGGWQSTGRPWVYDGDRFERVAQARLREQETMLEYERTTSCRMAFLRGTLDDPELTPDWRCGRCDRCSTVPLPPLPDAAHIAEARAEMDRPGIDVNPRRQWPSGMNTLGIDVSGRIPVQEQAEQGRAVARLDGLGWSGPLRELFASSTPDGEVPTALRTAAVRVLDDWDRTPMIDGIVFIESATRPQLVSHLSNGLGRYLKKPVVGSITPLPGRDAGRRDVNSATRLAGVVSRLELSLSSAAQEGLPGRSILLVDDFTDSGWTLTVAARLLRLAGASEVLPFVLAVV